MRNIWKESKDRTRCDFALRQVAQPVPQPAALTLAPSQMITAIPEDDQEPIRNPIITAIPIQISSLARRAPSPEHDESRHAYIISDYLLPMETNPNDMRPVQRHYRNCLQEIYRTCVPSFWELFLPVNTFPVNVIDTFLRAAKRTFLVQHTPDWKRFPTSRRALLQKIGCIDGFWPSVKHTCVIDLTRVLRRPLASGTRTLTFNFLDPVWAWLTVARDLSPADLHWKPAAQNSLNPMYGGDRRWSAVWGVFSRSLQQLSTRRLSHVCKLALGWYQRGRYILGPDMYRSNEHK